MQRAGAQAGGCRTHLSGGRRSQQLRLLSSQDLWAACKQLLSTAVQLYSEEQSREGNTLGAGHGTG